LHRRSLTDGEDTVVLATSGVVGPRWSEDGTLLAFRKLSPLQPGKTRREAAIVLVSADGRNERLLTEPSAHELTPFDWSSDGNWILGTCEHGPVGRRGVCLLPVSSAPRAQEQMRVIASDPERNLYQATFSPNQQWITFIAAPWGARVSTVYVVDVNGGQWTPISEGTFWDDKPRWSPDGKTIYFLSNRSGFLNVWGRRFDPITGKPAGNPFQVTSIDAASTRVLSPTVSTELAISPDRLILPIVESAGSVWVLENIDR
jgi:dipeptidyl aminopeptidase/acylaminoacyl peptidase